jgi:hypothetical protein
MIRPVVSSNAATLQPGSYILELETLRPASTSTILHVLEHSGFGNFAVDREFAGMPRIGQKVRIVADLEKPACVAHVPGVVKWKLVHRLSVSPSSQRAHFGKASSYLELENGAVYESRIATRNKAFLTREKTWTGIRLALHEPIKLVELRRHARLSSEPGGTWSQWLAWTRWLGPTGPHPQHANLIFEEVRKL